MERWDGRMDGWNNEMNGWKGKKEKTHGKMRWGGFVWMRMDRLHRDGVKFFSGSE